MNGDRRRKRFVKSLSIVITPDMLEEIKKVMAKTKKSKSQLVREGLRTVIKTYSEKQE